MSDFIPWLRGLAQKGGEGVVNNIDARSLGRIADELERLDGEISTTMTMRLKADNERLLAALQWVYEKHGYSHIGELLGHQQNAAQTEVK